MYKRWLLPIFMLISTLIWADVPVTIRRICEDGRDNNIYFTPTSDPCPSFIEYQIWGRNGTSGPFSQIGTITNKVQDNFTHLNASPTVATNWEYFIVIIDNCGPDLSTYSDTVSVDRTPPQPILLDSASINPLTNEPYLGWHNNLSPDFSHYKVYSVIGNIYTVISPSQKDTFFQVTTPVNGPKEFNISNVDSCDNETSFLNGKHTTMFLTLTVDTCLKETNLSWTPYIGWNSISRYEIFGQKDGGDWFLVGTVSESQTTFRHPILLGSAYKYYIRAYKAATIISASSNSESILTRYRIEPKNNYITSVSVLKPNDPTVELHIFNPNQEVLKYSIQTSETQFGTYTQIGEISLANSNITTYNFLTPFVAKQKYYKAFAINACGDPFPTTNISRYSGLTTTAGPNQNNINWEPYFTWNSGIDFYNIYRGTNDNLGNIQYNLIDAVSGSDTNYVDVDLPEIVGENGLCYYIEAIQNIGDSNHTVESALSIQSCILGEFKVFIPNAFHPFGVNTIFRPEGSYIDYNNSEMEIYDRYGKQLISISGIRNGWNGKDSDGTLCMPGVYVYLFKLISTNGKKQNFSGTITLLN